MTPRDGEPDEFDRLVLEYQAIHEEHERFEAEYASFLNRPLDTLAIVLRSHLLLEHYIDELVKLKAPALANWDAARLTFAQKLTLVDDGRSIVSWLAPGIRGINTLRNRAAHTLTSELGHGDVAPMAQVVEIWHSAAKLPIPDTPTGIIQTFTALACSWIASSSSSVRSPHHDDVIRRIIEWVKKRRPDLEWPVA